MNETKIVFQNISRGVKSDIFYVCNKHRQLTIQNLFKKHAWGIPTLNNMAGPTEKSS